MGFAVGSTHPTVPLFVSRTRPSRWGLSNLHRLLAPLLDAAVASVQAQTKPVPAGRKITGLDVRTEADIRMLRIGGDLPVHRRARARQPVLGLRNRLAVQQHLDAGQAGAVLERPARTLKAAPDPPPRPPHAPPGPRPRRAVRSEDRHVGEE